MRWRLGVHAVLASALAFSVGSTRYLPTNDGPQHVFAAHIANVLARDGDRSRRAAWVLLLVITAVSHLVAGALAGGTVALLALASRSPKAADGELSPVESAPRALDAILALGPTLAIGAVLAVGGDGNVPNG